MSFYYLLKKYDWRFCDRLCYIVFHSSLRLYSHPCYLGCSSSTCVLDTDSSIKCEFINRQWQPRPSAAYVTNLPRHYQGQRRCISNNFDLRSNSVTASVPISLHIPLSFLISIDLISISVSVHISISVPISVLIFIFVPIPVRISFFISLSVPDALISVLISISDLIYVSVPISIWTLFQHLLLFINPYLVSHIIADC